MKDEMGQLADNEADSSLQHIAKFLNKLHALCPTETKLLEDVAMILLAGIFNGSVSIVMNPGEEGATPEELCENLITVSSYLRVLRYVPARFRPPSFVTRSTHLSYES